LDYQTPAQIAAPCLAKVNTDRKIELIRKRREEKQALDAVRQNVQREQVAAGDILEGKQDKNKGRNLKTQKASIAWYRT